jgi:hypothetical protein
MQRRNVDKNRTTATEIGSQQQSSKQLTFEKKMKLVANHTLLLLICLGWQRRAPRETAHCDLCFVTDTLQSVCNISKHRFIQTI